MAGGCKFPWWAGQVDGYTSVFAAEVLPGEPGKKPVKIKLIDAKTKAPTQK